MPIPSPFHERTKPLCKSYRWKDWAGYYAVCSYDYCHDPEYNAFRQTAGMIDVTPLYKYEVRGPDSQAFLSRMMVKNIAKLRVGRVTYCCWTDDRGKVVDDGTVHRLTEDHYRVTAADPTYHWLKRLSHGYDVAIEDSSQRIATLALQGPTSRDILGKVSDADMDALKFFRVTKARMDGFEVEISRTGYTGDLGYEIWTEAKNAHRLWDILMDGGRDHGIRPCGLDALDVTRIEAGFIMLQVDYYSAPKVVLESRKSSPFEIGLGWTVNLERDPFVGQQALVEEKRNGSPWQMRGLVASWEELERLYERYGLPPSLPATASREAVPVFQNGRQVGRATSHTWSPVLKKMISIACIETDVAAPGTRLQIEHTVEYERCSVSATVVETPFFDPPRKRKP